jgi:hypothetical protein
MSRSTQRIIFDHYMMPSMSNTDNYFYSTNPVLQLEVEATYDRTSTQINQLGTPGPTVADPVFGTSLKWAYCSCKVQPLSTGDASNSQANLPTGVFPVRYVDYAERQTQIDPPTPSPTQQLLCLFNVIVALEWQPDAAYLLRLAWAFRRASDFLYDVTDGMMAFGQVTFGGPNMLDCADIQLMASNRFHPRSWTDALHIPHKYMPIRMGRGLWHKANRVSIPWDEPEGYRTIVHEWAHYALALKDEYLEARTVVPAAQAGLPHLPAALLVDLPQPVVQPLSRSVNAPAPASAPASGATTYQVIVPQISLAVQSIMATLEGTSELIPQAHNSSATRKQQVWQQLRDKFPFLQLSAVHQPLDGPGTLPLPLPSVHRLALLPQNETTPGDELTLQLPAAPIALEHCWIYVLKGDGTAPQGLVAQGTADAGTAGDGFRLLGAQQGDTLVLIGHGPDGSPVVLQTTITGVQEANGQRTAVVGSWTEVTPAFEAVDVLPEPVASGEAATLQVRVRVSPQPDQAWVIPLGSATALSLTDQPLAMPTLDGHVLARWNDGALMICPFSQGGGPRTSGTSGPPPVTAGSAEGNVMLFFADDGQDVDYSDVRVVTTCMQGVENQLGGATRPHSYTFSLGATKALPTSLHPTLVMYYDRPTTLEEGDLIIHRQRDDQTWEPVLTYHRPRASFAAAPLHVAAVGGRLVAESLASGEERVERYRLFWVPRM